MALQIKTHEDADGGFAIHVKTHGLTFAEGGTEAQRERAWNRAQRDWWRDADEAAKAAGYSGGCASGGRSGGWCIPYDETVDDDTRSNGGRSIDYEDDDDAPRFVAFADAIGKLHDAMPQRFADALREAIAEDAEEEEREAERARNAAHDAAVLAMVPRLVAALRKLSSYAGGSDTPPSHPCRIACDTLEAFDALQAGNVAGNAAPLLDALENIAAHDYITGCGAQLDALFRAWINSARAALRGYYDSPAAPRVRKVCEECGSDDVSADAFARWNVHAQEWQVSAIMDKGHACENCGGECRIKDAPLDDGAP